MNKKSKKKMTSAEVKARITKHWNDNWWGSGGDCDRCRARSGSAPCAGCGIWPYLVADYRAGRLMKEEKFK